MQEGRLPIVLRVGSEILPVAFVIEEFLVHATFVSDSNGTSPFFDVSIPAFGFLNPHCLG